MSNEKSNQGIIRTVLGDIQAHDLGATNYHEHLFQVSPLLKGDELDDEALSSKEASALKDSGFDTMVDATPLGLGARPEALARISKSTGLKIVATTGRHRQEHYNEGHWARDFSLEKLEQRLIEDLTKGLQLSDGNSNRHEAPVEEAEPVRAGILKAGIGYWSINSFERQTLDAVGAAHVATGAPVMIHLEFGTAAHEVLDILEALSVPASSVVLAHADRNLDSGLHCSLIERGAYLGYDGMARAKNRSDQELLTLTREVVEAVGSSRILIGGDVARRTRYIAYGGIPGLAYLGKRYLPRLRSEIGDSHVEAITRSNPAHWLSWKI
jgi:predicted metal-dependent phosphotriesterase family hydrolase